MAFITQFSQAQENAMRFSAALTHSESGFFCQSEYHQSWYYFPDADVFAPAEFIGYQDIGADYCPSDNIDELLQITDVLNDWFYLLDRNTSMYQDLALRLKALLAQPAGQWHDETTADNLKIYVPLAEWVVTHYPDDITSEYYRHSGIRTVLVNGYERDPKARAACIEYYGCACYICHFDFSKAYGEIGREFIHVHHLKEAALIGDEYEVNPIADLRPLCPNCHAMVHRTRPAMSPEALRSLIDENLS